MNQEHSDRHSKVLLAIKHRRESLSYSQEYLAAKLNISQNCYSKTELATIRMTMNRFLKICEVLEISPVALLSA